jgi:bacillithiol biosynthesis deacetylase BshB1
MAVDILAVGAHPDDCEIFMGGTLIRMVRRGLDVAVCDLTRGEAGTYGSAESRREEIACSNAILGITKRTTLDLGDGRLEDSEANRMALVEVIRRYRPRLLFTFDERFTRHPDHRACAQIALRSAFLAGLEKLDAPGEAHRPRALIRFPELMISQKPDFVIDVTDCWESRLQAVRCYGSQVSAPGERQESKTLLRSHHFWELLRSRSVQAGGWGGCELAEPFYSDQVPLIGDPLAAFDRSFV